MIDIGEGTRFRVAVSISAFLLAALAAPMVVGEVYVHNDLGCGLIPGRAYLAECLATGEGTRWCSSLFGGFYVLGEGGGIAHPWTRALYAWFPLGAALNLEILWPYAAMLVGFGLLMLRWGVNRDAAVVGGLVYAFGGHHAVHYIHPTVMAGIAHIPWLLLAIDGVLRSPESRRVVVSRTAYSLLTISQILGAHTQLVWISVLVEVVYAIFLAAAAPASAQRLLGLAVSKAVGVLGGSIQLLPLWEAFLDSTRATPSRLYVGMGSLPPLNLLQWVAPYLTTSRVITPPLVFEGGIMQPAVSMQNDWRVHDFAIYPGAAVPVLLAVLVVRGSIPGPLRHLARPSGLMAVGALVLGLGDFTPLFALTSTLPVVGAFRVPSRYLTIFQLGVAALSAVAYAAVSRYSSRREPAAWRDLWPLTIPVVASVLVWLAPLLPSALWPWYARDTYLAPAVLMALGPVLVGTATLLVVLAVRGSKVALLALPLFMACDQAAYALHAMMITPPTDLNRYLAARPVPPGAAGSRVHFNRLHMVWQNPYIMKGLRLVQGYVAVPPRRFLSYERPASLRVAGVEWVLPGAEGSDAWQHLPNALPRARFVTRSLVSTDPDHDLDRIDVETTALTDRVLPPLNEPGAPPGLAQLIVDRPGKLDVVATVQTRQLLVISESYHRGWRAWLDGRTTAVFRVNGDFLGCLVPPGSHRVRLRFQPWSETAGFWLSVLGLVLTAAVPFMASARRAGAVPAPHLEIAAPGAAKGRARAGAIVDRDAP
jgi:hypothetical protein